MLALRRLGPRSLPLVRANSTLQTADSLPPPPPPPDASAVETKTRGRRTPRRNLRPVISTEKPRQWNRPVAPGVLPAYDLALALIQQDSASLKAEAAQVKAEIEIRDKNGQDASKLQDKLHILEVQSEINLPEVRWNVANAMVDMRKPVHRHLVEQKWRKNGDLDLLMERIYQMHVVPDVLPDLHPSLDLRITAPSTKQHFFATGKVDMEIEPGVFVTPDRTRKPPKLYANVFHPEERLYTLLMVDPDVPDVENASFQSYLHWLKPNIKLSAMTRTRLEDLNTHTRYIPPHPQNGTPYHRYCLFLLPQTGEISVPVVADDQRLGFRVRPFLAQHGLQPASGGGAHMWRAIWDSSVSDIYRDDIQLDEPRFGRARKPDHYELLKESKRYV